MRSLVHLLAVSLLFLNVRIGYTSSMQKEAYTVTRKSFVATTNSDRLRYPLSSQSNRTAHESPAR